MTLHEAVGEGPPDVNRLHWPLAAPFSTVHTPFAPSFTEQKVAEPWSSKAEHCLSPPERKAVQKLRAVPPVASTEHSENPMMKAAKLLQTFSAVVGAVFSTEQPCLRCVVSVEQYPTAPSPYSAEQPVVFVWPAEGASTEQPVAV